jgi:uncharacterized protein (TIGR03437 family)
LATAGETYLTPLGAHCHDPDISNDGQTVLFLSEEDLTGENPELARQAFLVGSDGSGLRQVTAEAFGIQEAALSGDGQVVIVATASGKILRIDVATGQANEVVERSWQVLDQSRYPSVSSERELAVGGLAQVSGWGFSEAVVEAQPPLPFELEGVSVQVSGVQAPIQSVSPTMVVFQVPWEAPTGVWEDAAVEVNAGGDSPFEGMGEGPPFSATNSVLPDFVVHEPEQVVPFVRNVWAEHAGLRALINPDSPAMPGEVIHIRMTGLGPVTPAVASGRPGPSAPPARTVFAASCSFAFASNLWPAEVLDSVLEPGTVGFYRVTVRVPFETPDGEIPLTCGVANPTPQLPDQKWIPIGERPRPWRARTSRGP